MKRIGITILSFLFTLPLVYGQTEATYSQYMFNGLAINPAYAGTHQSLSLTALSRMQSIGLDGAPRTQTFAAHNAFRERKVGLGVLFMNDRIGVTQQTGAYISYAYKIQFERSTLSLGLQGGGTLVDANYSELLIDDSGDPNFSEDIREFKPNFGAGIYFNSPNFYAGLSMPQMLDLGDKRISQLKPLILTSGLIFEISPNLMIKPNILFRYVEGRAVEFNYNTNLLFREVFWLGFSYRPNNSVNSLLEFQVTDQFRLGYAYELGISDLRRANNGTHEFMLNYRLIFHKKGVINPRYF